MEKISDVVDIKDDSQAETSGSIEVILKGYALIQQARRKGIYKQYKECNGKMSWRSETDAIWFVPKSNSWGIGPIEKIGTTDWGIAAIENTGGDSPLDIPNDQWALHNGHHGWTIPKSGSIVIKRAIHEEGMIRYYIICNHATNEHGHILF